MADIVLRHVRAGGALPHERVGSLSDRESEVFKRIGKGMTSRQIAQEFNVSPKTIETHRENIKAKLNLRNAAELYRVAVEWVLENG